MSQSNYRSPIPDCGLERVSLRVSQQCVILKARALTSGPRDLACGANMLPERSFAPLEEQLRSA